MSIMAMANNGIENIRAEMDGAIYDLFADRNDLIVRGIGSEFAINYSSSSLVCTIGSGLALIGGRLFKIEGTESISLVPSSENIVCLRVDLSAGDGNEGSIQIHVSESSIVKQNINGGGSIRDMKIFTIQTNASGVGSVEDTRNIIYTGASKNILEVYTDNGYVTAQDDIVTIIPCSSRQLRVGDELSMSNGGVYISHTGWYRVCGSCYIISNQGALTRVGCFVQKNDITSANELTSQWLGTDPNGSSYGNVYSGERIVRLSKGDTVYLCARVKGNAASIGHRWLIVERVALG